MALRDAIAEALAGREGWMVEMALALAGEVDEKGTASAAKELRTLMDELGASAPAPAQKESGLSEFERRLRERESKAEAPRRAKGG